MLFQTTAFAFLLVMLLAYYLSPRGARKYTLLAGSVFFIIWQGGKEGILVLAIVTILTWLLGLPVYFLRQKKSAIAATTLAAAGIACLALLLFLWKYLPWFAQQREQELTGFLALAIPIGLSFYIFQAISYLADVKSGKIPAETNPFKFALYMMWFPKWMSGPIERAGAFNEEIEKSSKARIWDEGRLSRAFSYIIWGLFMKMVIADRLAKVVDMVYEEPSNYGALIVILASILYTLQIYCDFAGYTNTMMGISTLFGIELTQNFKTPYLSDNIIEFWRRWHISLSNFLKDYIYIPLGGNRKGQLRKFLNTVIVFVVCGMWHGAGLSFLVWGLLHGFFTVIANILKKAKADVLVEGITGKIITFCLVSFAWIFFKADSMGHALGILGSMMPKAGGPGLLEGLASAEEGIILGISTVEWWVVILSLAVMIIMDIYARSRDTVPPEALATRWSDVPRAALLTVVLIVVFIFGVYGAGEEIRSFVYAQF